MSIVSLSVLRMSIVSLWTCMSIDCCAVSGLRTDMECIVSLGRVVLFRKFAALWIFCHSLIHISDCLNGMCRSFGWFRQWMTKISSNNNDLSVSDRNFSWINNSNGNKSEHYNIRSSWYQCRFARECQIDMKNLTP